MYRPLEWDNGHTVLGARGVPVADNWPQPVQGQAAQGRDLAGDVRALRLGEQLAILQIDRLSEQNIALQEALAKLREEVADQREQCTLQRSEMEKLTGNTALAKLQEEVTDLRERDSHQRSEMEKLTGITVRMWGFVSGATAQKPQDTHRAPEAAGARCVHGTPGAASRERDHSGARHGGAGGSTLYQPRRAAATDSPALATAERGGAILPEGPANGPILP